MRKAVILQMLKLAYLLTVFCFFIFCPKSHVSDDRVCKNYSYPVELEFYSNSFTQDWLLEEISPDSVHIFFFQTVFDFYEGSTIDEVTAQNLSDDDLFIYHSERERSRQYAEAFLSQYEEGNRIWSFDNSPSNPGNLGWEYGLLILEDCHLKHIRPIKKS